MSFWEFLGVSALFDYLFHRKKGKSHGYISSNREYERAIELDESYDDLSSRIDDLEDRLNECDPESEMYYDLYDEVEQLRDELDELEDGRYDYYDGDDRY